ncbi:MAG: hypothetical protein DRN66_02900 [Candidatus Nanohalarchaeota archaeon]|nr:MAG: hypothetical protein DRN66_02900 [Candidatus Nanohaloarchaeota archaeon]
MDNIEEKIQIIDNYITEANLEIGRLNNLVNENQKQIQKLENNLENKKHLGETITLKNENKKLHSEIKKLQELIGKCEKRKAEAFLPNFAENKNTKTLKSRYYSLAVDNKKYEKYRDLINAILLKVTALNRKRMDFRYKNKTSELIEQAENCTSQLEEILAKDDEELTIPLRILDRDMYIYIRSLDEQKSQTKGRFRAFLKDKKASLFPGTRNTGRINETVESTEESRKELRYQIERVIEEIAFLLNQSK